MADETPDAAGEKAVKEPKAPGKQEEKTSAGAGSRGADEIRYAVLEAKQDELSGQLGDLATQMEALVGVLKEREEGPSKTEAPTAPSPEEEEVALQNLAERFGVSADFLRYQHDQMKRLGATVQQSFDALATKVESLLPQEKLAMFQEQTGRRIDTLAGENIIQRFLLANPELLQPENKETFDMVFDMVQKGEGRVTPTAAYDLVKTRNFANEYHKLFADVPEGKKSEARKRVEAAIEDYLKSEKAKSEAAKPVGPEFIQRGRAGHRELLADMTGVERPKGVGDAKIEREIISRR